MDKEKLRDVLCKRAECKLLLLLLDSDGGDFARLEYLIWLGYFCELRGRDD